MPDLAVFAPRFALSVACLPVAMRARLLSICALGRSQSWRGNGELRRTAHQPSRRGVRYRDHHDRHRRDRRP